MNKADQNAARELARLLGVSVEMFCRFLTETKHDRSAIAYAWAVEGPHVAARPFFDWLMTADV